MKIAVIDGQGGGIGRALVEKLRNALGPDADILALGTNALSTAAMLKAGASEGASGEHAILQNVPKADVIAGCIGILAAGSMLGEITPAAASAVGMSDAQKVLIPLGKCMVHVAGVIGKPLPQYIDDAVAVIAKIAGIERKASANAYLLDRCGNASLIMEDVVRAAPLGGGVLLEDASGARKTVKAKLREALPAEGRILLEEL